MTKPNEPPVVQYAAPSTSPKGGGLQRLLGQLGLGFGAILIPFGCFIGLVMSSGLADEPGHRATWRDGVVLGGPFVAIGLALFFGGAKLYQLSRRRAQGRP